MRLWLKAIGAGLLLMVASVALVLCTKYVPLLSLLIVFVLAVVAMHEAMK